jgi:hypothetical protein
MNEGLVDRCSQKTVPIRNFRQMSVRKSIGHSSQLIGAELRRAVATNYVQINAPKKDSDKERVKSGWCSSSSPIQVSRAG